MGRAAELALAARARPLRTALLGAALALAMAAWAWVAHELWRTSVPAGLRLPHVSPERLFGSSFLHRSARYERLIDTDALLASVALLVVLALYARRGARLMRESAAGPIGTGMLLGMLGLGIVWIVEVPFGLVAVWWERRHHVSHQGYVASVLQGFLQLGGRFLFVCLALLVAMGLARALGRWWWLAAAPPFAGLALLFSFVSIYLVPDTYTLRDGALAADARTLAQREGVGTTRLLVQRVQRYTTAPNAEAVGFGSTRGVVLWDTLLDGRFSRREIDAVLAHELGHLAHAHALKRGGWLALFLLPATALVAGVTRRRGGLARAEAVPLALFVFVALQLVTAPLTNMVSRREEAEADWSSLQATHAPATARALFENLATSSLADPDPPTWSYVLYGGHPTIVQRVAMAQAWQARAKLR